MVKRIVLSILAVAGLLVLALAGSAVWILHSESGTRWLLTSIPAWTGMELQAEHIEGTLLGDLHLEEIELQQGELRLHLQSLEMQSRLRGFFPLQLDFSRLHLAGVHLDTPSPEPAPAGEKTTEQPDFDLTWPEPPALLSAIDFDIKQLMIEDFLWQSGSDTRLQIDKLESAVTWQDSTLQIREFAYDAPDFSLTGAVTVGLEDPLLKVEARLVPSDPTGEVRSLRIQADLQPGPNDLPRGQTALTVKGAEHTIIEASTHLQLDANRLEFSDLQITRPEREGKITGHGSLDFAAEEPQLTSNLQITRLDLGQETGQPLIISGTLEFGGWLDNYQGRFNLRNQAPGLADAQLAGKFSGNLQEAALTDLRGQWLGGDLQGRLTAGWAEGWQVAGRLAGGNLDLTRIDTQLAGMANLEVQADISQGGDGTPEGRIQVQLNESRLHGQPVSGAGVLRLQDSSVMIDKMHLQGEGFLVRASGDPTEKVTFEFNIDQLGNLLAGAAGELFGGGWLRWQQGTLSGALQAEAVGLSVEQWQAGHLQLSGEVGETGQVFDLNVTGRNLSGPQEGLALEQLQLSLAGRLADHELNLELVHTEGALSAAASGSWQENAWTGQLSRLKIQNPDLATWRLQQPVPVHVSREVIEIDPLQLTSGERGTLGLQGRFQPQNNQFAADIQWQSLDLSLANPWLGEFSLEGSSSGSLNIQQAPDKELHGELAASGRFHTPEATFQIDQGDLAIDWDQTGLTARIQLQTDDGAALDGSVTSDRKLNFALPPQGTLQLTGTDFPIRMFQPWLPPEINAAGALSWSADGRWRDGGPMELTGDINLRNGRLSWQEEEGIITADIQQADLQWQWHERLRGQLELLMEQHGRIEADFGLAVPARLPLHLDPDASLTADVQARLQEKGLLALFFPSRVQETRGQLEVDLQVAGSLRQPDLQGQFTLSGARAYLPPAGIQLEDVSLQGAFDGSRLEINSLEMTSGEGRLEGQGRLEMTEWQPGAYRLELTGEDFQLVNLPDLRVAVSPDLKIEGQGKQLHMRGEILLPEVIVTGGPAEAPVENSPDLVVVDRPEPAGPKLELDHDIEVQLILGDRVLIDLAGIDARLTGELEVRSAADQELAAYGEIQVAKGTYSSYGVRLDITRGNLFFNGGPIAGPTLDILAIRKAGDVEAGVKVTGTPQDPIVNLYSAPPMPDTEILSYIVLGRPLGSDAAQSSLLLTAASTLLSRGESVMLQDKLKSRLGLDVLDISAGEGDVESSIVTTGKYLTPDLYVSFGYALFSNSNELKIRYNLAPDWELESTIGTESGVDLYYKIELD